ncbi:MAG: hypothetical protein Q8Q33_08305 [Chlamydiota bacterium]|nr:hypothetical protein [Chlamydiota bacterium]
MTILVQKYRGLTENEAREVAIYLAYLECELTHREIAIKFNIGHPGTVGWCCTKVRRKLRANKDFVGDISKLKNVLKSTLQQRT